MRLLYNGLFYLAVPFVLARLAWRGVKAPGYRQRWPERFGYYSGQARPGVLWFHAVSVGEAEAAFPLIASISRRFPGQPILVTTTTPTGSARVRAVLGDSVQHVYLPYDLPGCVARFMGHFLPSLAVIMETEIWPNLYRACGVRGIPLAIVNGRLSVKSARGYARLSSLTRECLAPVRLIAAQTATDAARFVQVGAKAEAVQVTGNIKFDMEFSPGLVERARKIRADLFDGRPVFIAGSTHDGEDALLLDAFEVTRKRHPDLLLVLAPRHPERFAKVDALCRARGLMVQRRSAHAPCAGADIFLLDTLGELKLFYAAGDLAFVGGSLVPTGGHNVLEPAMAGIPVLFGAHTFNFEEASRRLVEAGGGLRVAGPDGLAATVLELLDTPARREAIGKKARDFVEQGRGALGRVEELLCSLLAGAGIPGS
ncbi:MAG: three-deoxy-D-manno-octulosonic-acid transferase domain protein [Proteobacteria bacterium]|nr:three-deoxy-D-manno-octulosonic-acid transferase domain protein [Pseudomonadota bacterium]